MGPAETANRVDFTPYSVSVMESTAVAAAGTNVWEPHCAVRTTAQIVKGSLPRRLVYFVPLSENELRDVERRRCRAHRQAVFRARLTEEQEAVQAAGSATRQRMRDRRDTANGKLPCRYSVAFGDDSENVVPVWAQRLRQHVG